MKGFISMKRKWLAYSDFEIKAVGCVFIFSYLIKFFQLWLMKKTGLWPEAIVESIEFSITSAVLAFILVGLVSRRYQVVRSYKFSEISVIDKISHELSRIDFVLKKKRSTINGGLQLIYRFENWSIIGKETIKITFQKGKVYITGYKNTLDYLMTLKFEDEASPTGTLTQ